MKYLVKAALASCLLSGSVFAASDIAPPQNTNGPHGSSTASSNQAAQAPQEVLFKLKADRSAGQTAGARTQSFGGNSASAASDVATSHGLLVPKEIGKGNAPATPPATMGARSATQSSQSSGKSSLNIFKAKAGPGQNLDSLVEALDNDPRVEWAEINGTWETQATTPNDSEFSKTQQYLAATNITQIWDQQQGSEDVVIAIVDTGVDYTRPDLEANIWINPGEIPGNGIDDDGNGYIDDVRGWNFSSNEEPGLPENDPMDLHEHGTHVAGIAAAEGGNGIGIAGVSWNSKIMPVRAGRNGFSWSDTAEAMKYACDNGADIINMSMSGPARSLAVEAAVGYCALQDVLLVAAAGNDGVDKPYYPAGYNGVLSVAATNPEVSRLTNFSNYGISVDLAAPGENIHSTLPDGGYGARPGTSMASPFVAGMAALILSETPELTSSEVRTLLKNMARMTTDTPLGETASGYAWLDWPMNLSAIQPKASVVALSIEGNDETHVNNTFDIHEQLTIRPTVQNLTPTDQNVWLRLTTDSPYLNIDKDRIDLGAISPSLNNTNWDDAFRVTVLQGVPEHHEAILEVEVRTDQGIIGRSSQAIELNPALKTLNFISPVNQSRYFDPQAVEHPDGRVSYFYQSRHRAGEGRRDAIYHTIRELDGRWSEQTPIPVVDDFSISEYDANILNGKPQVVMRTNVYTKAIQYASYENAQWSSRIISTSEPGLTHYSRPVITTGPESDIYVAWRAFHRESNQEFLKLRHFNDGSWKPIQELVSSHNEIPSGSYYSPVIDNILFARGKNDSIHLLWKQQNWQESTGHIMHAQLDENGSFEPEIVAEASDLHSVNTDTDGNVHIVYTADNKTYHQFFNGHNRSEPYDITPAEDGILVANPSGEMTLIFQNSDTLKKRVFQNDFWSEPAHLHKLMPGEKFDSGKHGSASISTAGELLLSVAAKGETPFPTHLNLYSSNAYPAEKLVPVDEGVATQSHDIIAQLEASGNAPREAYFSIGSAPGQHDLADWQGAITNQSSDSPDELMNPLRLNDELLRSDLIPGQTYYLSTQIVDLYGYPSGIVSTDGITFLPGSAELSISSPSEGTQLRSHTQTFEWNPIPRANAYQIKIGSEGKGSSNLINAFVYGYGKTAYSAQDLPIDGRTLYLSVEAVNTIEKEKLGLAQSVYTAYGLPDPEIITPPNGSTFTSDEVEFKWKEIPGAISYTLLVGSAPGGRDIADADFEPETTSTIIDNLPTDGRTIYVTLSTQAAGQWTEREYTYTAYTLQSPPTLSVDFKTNWWFTGKTTLTWQGADAVDVYRNDTKVASATTTNPYTHTNSWFDSTRHDWKVCLPDTQVCSETRR